MSIYRDVTRGEAIRIAEEYRMRKVEAFINRGIEPKDSLDIWDLPTNIEDFNHLLY